MKGLTTKLKSPTYHFIKLQNKLYGEVNQYLKTTEGMNKSKLADKLGVTKGYISQILNNGADHKLSRMIKLSLAIEKIPVIEFLEPDEFLKREIKIRKDRIPLDLSMLHENIEDSKDEVQMEKNTEQHDLAALSLPYSEYNSYEIPH